MEVYEAIRQMRALTKQGKHFSFSFMSYSQTRGESHGIVEVRDAMLEKQSTREQNRSADMMLNYYDYSLNRNGRCYQPLLMEFNGIKLEL